MKLLEVMECDLECLRKFCDVMVPAAKRVSKSMQQEVYHPDNVSGTHAHFLIVCRYSLESRFMSTRCICSSFHLV